MRGEAIASSEDVKAEGVWAAALTTLSSDGRTWDAARFREHLRRTSALPLTGISVAAAGVQGVQSLELPVKTAMVETCRAVSGPELPVIAGTTATDVATCAAECNTLHSAGASAVMVWSPRRTPGSTDLPPGSATKWFHAVAELVTLPLVAYSNESAGSVISVDEVLSVMEHPRYIMTKEASRNVSRLLYLSERLRSEALGGLIWNMQSFYYSILMGSGRVMLPAPLAPWALSVWEAAGRGDARAAQHAQEFFARMPFRWSAHGLDAIARAVARATGEDIGPEPAGGRGLGPDSAASMEEYLRTWEHVAVRRR